MAGGPLPAATGIDEALQQGRIENTLMAVISRKSSGKCQFRVVASGRRVQAEESALAMFSVPRIYSRRILGNSYLAFSLDFSLPVDTPFGNLNRMYMMIQGRLERVNQRIEEAYRLFEAQKDSPLALKPFGMCEAHATEEIVYWLRKTADELIGIIQILSVRIKMESYPTAVNPDCIGDLLNDTACPVGQVLKEHLVFLKTLNDASNAYKHSLVNTETGIIGKDEPCVLVLELKWNDLNRSQPRLVGVTLRKVIDQFNAFLQTCDEWIAKCPLSRSNRPIQTDSTKPSAEPPDHLGVQ